jgi:hypothetical protein
MLESFMVHKTLWFSAQLANWGDIKHEFVNAKSDSKRKDDIIDSIAHLAGRTIPATPAITKTEKEQSMIVWDMLAQKQLHDMYFGIRENATPPPAEALPLDLFDTGMGMAKVCCPHCGFSPCIGS